MATTCRAQVCTACGTIHYQNPKLVAGCVPEHEGRILLCRRAIEPRRGYWTIPAGFMENEETLQQAAARECREEALARVEIGSLCAIVHVLHAHQVHVMFRADARRSTHYGVGVESLEVDAMRRGRDPLAGDRVSRASNSRCAGISRIAPPAPQDLHFTTIDMRLQGREATARVRACGTMRASRQDPPGESPRMTFVVTESCIKCKYMDCVEVCPVDCFHEGPNFLVIDPEECIDCTLCEPECPVEAIYSEEEVPGGPGAVPRAQCRAVTISGR